VSWFKWLHFWLGFRNCWVRTSAGADLLGLVFLLFSLVFASKCSDNTSKQAMTVSFHVHSVSYKCMKWELVFCSQLILLPYVWMIDFKLNELESWRSLKQLQLAWLKFSRPRVVHLSWVGTSGVCTLIQLRIPVNMMYYHCWQFVIQVHTFQIACLVLASVCGHSIDPISNLSLLHVALCSFTYLVGKVSNSEVSVELIFIILM
jgi:hypothetical protein